MKAGEDNVFVCMCVCVCVCAQTCQCIWAIAQCFSPREYECDIESQQFVWWWKNMCTRERGRTTESIGDSQIEGWQTLKRGTGAPVNVERWGTAEQDERGWHTVPQRKTSEVMVGEGWRREDGKEGWREERKEGWVNGNAGWQVKCEERRLKHQGASACWCESSTQWASFHTAVGRRWGDKKEGEKRPREEEKTQKDTQRKRGFLRKKNSFFFFLQVSHSSFLWTESES